LYSTEGPLELICERRPVGAQKEAGQVVGFCEPGLVEPHGVGIPELDHREATTELLRQAVGEQRQKVLEHQRADWLFRVRRPDQQSLERPAGNLDAADGVAGARDAGLPHVASGVGRGDAIAGRLELVQRRIAVVVGHGRDDLVKAREHGVAPPW